MKPSGHLQCLLSSKKSRPSFDKLFIISSSTGLWPKKHTPLFSHGRSHSSFKAELSGISHFGPPKPVWQIQASCGSFGHSPPLAQKYSVGSCPAGAGQNTVLWYSQNFPVYDTAMEVGHWQNSLYTVFPSLLTVCTHSASLKQTPSPHRVTSDISHFGPENPSGQTQCSP